MSDKELEQFGMTPGAQAATDDLVEGHEYDGIQEFDNPTPGWWHLIFLGTILFSIGYAAFWHLSPVATTPEQRLARIELVEIKRQFADLGELTADRATIVRMMGDEKWMAYAKSTFDGNCVSCHGSKGQGLVGPNLTDDHFKGVHEIEDIARIISDGAASGAMPAWKSRLHPNEVVLLASYVASLRGQIVPGGRPPEGERIEAWPMGFGTTGGQPEASSAPSAG